LKRPKTKGDYGISLTNKLGFVASLYATIPRLQNGGMITCKHFAKDYNLKCEGLSPKQVKVPKDVGLEEISKFFGPIINKNGYSYVHSNDLGFIEKVEYLWMTIHQKTYLPSSQLISLRMARGLACEKMGKAMNWVMYGEWTNR
jgi:hypothetical protein